MPVLRILGGISAARTALGRLFPALPPATAFSDADLLLINSVGTEPETVTVGALRAGLARVGHGHALGDTAGLQAALDGKQPASPALTAAAATTGVGPDDQDLLRGADPAGAAWLHPPHLRANLFPGPSTAAALTLTSLHHGRVIRCTAALTLTLPAAATLAPGWWCRVKHRGGGGVVTLACQGSDTIDGSASVTLADNAALAVVRFDAGSFETC